MGSAEEKKNFIKKIASPDISKKIEEKLNIIYDNWDSYETINKKLVALENQEVGMVYTIDVTRFIRWRYILYADFENWAAYLWNTDRITN